MLVLPHRPHHRPHHRPLFRTLRLRHIRPGPRPEGAALQLEGRHLRGRPGQHALQPLPALRGPSPARPTSSVGVLLG